MFGIKTMKLRIARLEDENEDLKSQVKLLEDQKWELVNIIKGNYNSANDALQKPAYSKESLKVKLREIRSTTESTAKKYQRFIDVIVGGKRSANR